ncbi:hypothetical protein CR513_55526, partial [Mucuna pruriens]
MTRIQLTHAKFVNFGAPTTPPIPQDHWSFSKCPYTKLNTNDNWIPTFDSMGIGGVLRNLVYYVKRPHVSSTRDNLI